MLVDDFLDFLKNILIYPDEFIIDGNYQNFYKDNIHYFCFDAERNWLYCSYRYIWCLFKENFNFSENVIEFFIKDMLSKEFKMNNISIDLIFS